MSKTGFTLRFLGLLDAVSSLIEENRLLDFVPVLKMVKQNYGDQPLSVLEAVRKCVHFAAAHELRFYQRLANRNRWTFSAGGCICSEGIWPATGRCGSMPTGG